MESSESEDGSVTFSGQRGIHTMGSSCGSASGTGPTCNSPVDSESLEKGNLTPGS